jgi:hypothetical protein
MRANNLLTKAEARNTLTLHGFDLQAGEKLYSINTGGKHCSKKMFQGRKVYTDKFCYVSGTKSVY